MKQHQQEVKTPALSFLVPSGWQDSSTIVLVRPMADGSVANLIVTRDRAWGGDLAGYVAKQQADLKGTAALKVVARDRVTIDGAEALVVEQLLTLPAAEPGATEKTVHIHQRQAYVGTDDGVVTVTVSTPRSSAPMLKEVFQTALSSLQWAQT